MVDAQEWLKENYEDKNNKNSKVIVAREGTELKGELEIIDYPNLESIFLPFTRGITMLNINNCPNVRTIFVPGNKIKNIGGIKELVQLRVLNFGENQVKEIDVSNNTVLEEISLYENPNFKFTGGFKTLENLPKLVNWNSANTLPIAEILEGLSENDLKEVADKLGVKTENKPKEDIKKEIIAEIEKNNQNKEKLKDPKTGIPDLLNENGEIDKDKLGKLKDDAKKYEALVAEPKNDPIKNEDKKDIDQGSLTKLIEDFEKFKGLLDKAGINPAAPNAEKQAEDLKNTKEAVDKAGLDPTTDLGKQIDDLKKRPTQEDLNNAVKNVEDKYKDYINPNNPDDKAKLEQAAKNAGFIDSKDSSALEKAANGQGKTVVSQTDLNNLKNNQEKHKPEDLEKHKPGDLKPVDLPANWKEQLAKIPALTANQKPADYDAIKNELNNWKNTFPSKSPADVKKETTGGSGTGATLTPIQQKKIEYFGAMASYLNREEGNWKEFIDNWKKENASYVERTQATIEQPLK